MKKVILAVSMLVAMAVVFGLPSFVMAGIPPVSCTSDAECNDSNDCTDDTCDVGVTDVCVFTNDDTNACSDSDLCTNDACVSGACVGTAINCDDINVCTADSCDSGTGLCVNAPDCSLDSSCNLGIGPGCSAIEGLDVTSDLVNGNCFTGRIGTTGVSGVTPNGSPAQDSDGDGCTDSLEECINSALVGFCSDVDVNDCDEAPGDGGEDITYVQGTKSGSKMNKQEFTATFQDITNCAITQCSNQVDDEPAACVGGLCVNGGAVCVDSSTCPPGDGLIDYPDDPECDSFSDNDESVL